MTAEDNADLARTVYEAWNNNQFDRCLATAAEDVEVILVPFGLTFRGRSGFNDFMKGFRTAFPDMRLTVTNQVATDTHVVTEFAARGTHAGPLRTPAGDIPPTGRTVDLAVCEVWQIKNGKLARLVNYQDSATMMRQLGLIS